MTRHQVPKLKEPYLHPKTSLCPKLLTSVRSLVSVKNNKLHPSTMDTESDIAYIKKVSGVQSLNIELSWRYDLITFLILSGAF